MLQNRKILASALAVVLVMVTGIMAVSAALWRDNGQEMSFSSGQDFSSSLPEPELPINEIASVPTEEPVVPEQEDNLPVTPVTFNRPSEMRAVCLIAGEDYLTDGQLNASKIQSDIDAAIQSAVDLTMNTLIIDLYYKDAALYQSSQASRIALSMDIPAYIISKAREHNLYIYALYDTRFAPDSETGKFVSHTAIDAALIDFNVQNLQEITATYQFDGILFENCYNETADSNYQEYLRQSPGADLKRYLTDTTYSMFRAISETMREHARGMQVGLLTSAAWANSYEAEGGSATRALFSALADGHADTKRWIEEGLCDFFAVQAYGSITDGSIPFETVVNWWADIAQKEDMPFYAVLAADRVGGSQTGWNAPDQLTKQAMVVRDTAGCSGGIYNSLRALQAQTASTQTLLKFFENKIQSSHILTELKVTQPEQKTFSTYEPMVTFMGASDPNFPVTLNGQALTTDENGFFTMMVELKAGLNTYVFEHKGKTETFNITRQVQILKEISPTGSITVEGGMQVSVSALAYQDAKVYAVINGTTVSMKLDETVDDSTDAASGYKKFTGTYTTPAAGTSAKNLGNIVVYGEWSGVQEHKQGANITVNAKVAVGDGKLVQINKDYAETFPQSPINDISNASYFPLAKGARDYTASNEISYKDGNNTYYYYLLASGVRVYASDISNVSGDELKNNAIKGMTVNSDGRYTTITFNTQQRVPYIARYSGSSFTIDFQYTSTVPTSAELDKNPLFSAANWSGSKLTLPLRVSGGFYGYTAYYENDNSLVFRFNSPPSSLGDATIVIDPGHGGSDPGALGNNPSFHEADINQAIASKVASILSGSAGAVYNTGGGMSLASRVNYARGKNPQIFVSIHCNTASSTSAKGTEAYYFYSFANRLASKVSSACASAFTSNRGEKFGLYYVTRTAEYAAVLLETGFLSNTNEYANLIESSVQNRIAQGIVNGISSTISATSQYAGLTGVQTIGTTAKVPVTGVTLSAATLELKVGGKATLTATVQPDLATNKTVAWSSSDEKIATVSASGEVTAVAIGTATITATTQDGGKTASCTVTVKAADIKVTEIVLNTNALSLEAGTTGQLQATVKPDEATNRTVTWSSDNEAVATVNSDGKVTAVSPGSATITVTAQDGSGVSASAAVTVSAATIPVSNITFQNSISELTVGQSAQLIIVVSPENATDRSVSWSTSDHRVATVDANGLVTAQGEGDVEIIVTANDKNHFENRLRIHVTAAPPRETQEPAPST